MNEKDYQIILTLYRTQNITKAAEQLFISQPALTKRIQNIEEELNTPIIIRSSRGIYFTAMGEKVIETFQRVQDSMQELRNYIYINKGEIGGSLRVGIPIDYARWYMPGMLEQFVTEYPAVSVDITTGFSSRLYKRLLSGDLCCSLIRGEYTWEESSLLLDEEPVCLACSKESDRSHLDTLSYMDRTTDDALHAHIHRWMEENRLHVVPKIHVDDMGTCQRLIRTGSWMIAPELVLNGFSGYIEPLYFSDGTPLMRRTYILCRSSYLQLPQVQKFIDMLMEYRGKKIFR